MPTKVPKAIVLSPYRDDFENKRVIVHFVYTDLDDIDKIDFITLDPPVDVDVDFVRGEGSDSSYVAQLVYKKRYPGIPVVCSS
tara:strand:- start:648 stop:896 length:249 start_codon:yes stop_codon:yes gene_type:complete